MPVDTQVLSTFYDEPIGQTARRLIGRRVRLIWPDVRGLRVLGYGYATPYVRPFVGEAERVVAFVPADQDIAPWPPGGSIVALGEEDALPFPDAFFDRIIMTHGLETAEAARPVMRQVWRVLAPQGRLLVAGRALALCAWPAVQQAAARSSAAGIDVRAGALGHRALLPAGAPTPADAQRIRLGARGPQAVAASGWCAHRRCHKVALRTRAAGEVPHRTARAAAGAQLKKRHRAATLV
jgi:SAM-dependent methyltransferase